MAMLFFTLFTQLYIQIMYRQFVHATEKNVDVYLFFGPK